MKRSLVPAAGVALLQSLGMPSALADADWDRYAASGYVYCDAVILSAHWGESVDEAKATIGRKLGWGNADIVASDLDEARDAGERCAFFDTGFVYEDAEALAAMWGVGVDDAKAALAEKVSTGYAELANEVVAQAHAMQGGHGDVEHAELSEFDHFAASTYQYCDAVILGSHWNQSVDEAKARIGRKLGWGDDAVIETMLRDARRQNRRCTFDDSGFAYEDAQALAAMWGVGIADAKAALAEKVSMGWRELANQVITQAHGG